MTSGLFSCGTSSTLTVNVTRYMALSRSSINSGLGATENGEHQIVGSAGTIENLYAELGTAPGSGNTVTITLRVNGADTALTCQIANTNTQATDTSNSVTVAAGDRINYKVVTSAANSAASLRVSSQYVGDTANESLILGSTGGVQMDSSGDFYLPPSGHVCTKSLTTDANARMLCPTAGTIKKFYMWLDTAPGGATSRKFEIYKNNAATGVTMTISGASTTGNDTSNTVAVSAGDLISIKLTNTGAFPAGALGAWGFVLTATTDGDFPVFGGTNVDPNTAAARYAPLFLQASSDWDTSDVRFMCGQTGTIKNLYVAMTTAPAAGKSWAVAVRNNSSDVLTATVADAATTGNASGTVSVANYDNLSLGVTPTGTPTAPVDFYWGVNMSLTAAATAFEPVTSWFL